MTDAVGVIIVTFNSRAHFARQKAALEAQTLPHRLIVIDNASAPDQRPRAEDFPAGAAIIQLDANTGFAHANNMGVALLDAPWAVLLNPDAFPEPTWLQHLVAAAKAAPDAASIGSTQVSAGDPAVYDGLGDCYHVFGIPWRGGYGWPTTAPPRAGEPFSACAAAALYRTDAWRAVGGFDEALFCYCEDVDLGFRLRLAGWRILQAPQAVVHHVGGASSGGRAGRSSDFALRYGSRNRLWTFMKNMPGWAFWVFAPAHAATTAYLLARAAGQGTFGPTWAGVREALAGLGPIWRARAQTQRTRTAPVVDILAMMAWSPLTLNRRAPVLRTPRAAVAPVPAR
ncbi:MAG: glycosyltransferase family 2 protein [Hyphomonadaceae bacterium]|nr:glycosyltransferase family 2 protein [Hyphomonadaceae bacterium]